MVRIDKVTMFSPTIKYTDLDGAGLKELIIALKDRMESYFFKCIELIQNDPKGSQVYISDSNHFKIPKNLNKIKSKLI